MSFMPEKPHQEASPMPENAMEVRGSKEKIFEEYAERRAGVLDDVLGDLSERRDQMGDSLGKVPKEIGDYYKKRPGSRGALAVIEGIVGRKVGSEEKLSGAASLRRVLLGSAILARDLLLNDKETVTGKTLEYLEGRVEECDQSDPEGSNKKTRMLRKIRDFVKENESAVTTTEKGLDKVLQEQVRNFA